MSEITQGISMFCCGRPVLYINTKCPRLVFLLFFKEHEDKEFIRDGVAKYIELTNECREIETAYSFHEIEYLELKETNIDNLARIPDFIYGDEQ